MRSELARYEQEFGSVVVDDETYVYVGEESLDPGFEDVSADRIEQLAVKVDDVEDQRGIVSCYRISSDASADGEDGDDLNWQVSETGLQFNLKTGEVVE